MDATKMMISTMRFPSPLKMRLQVNGVEIDVFVETPGSEYVAHAFSTMVGSPMELRRSLRGVSFVQNDKYPGQAIHWSITEDINYGLRVLEAKKDDYKPVLEPFLPTTE